MSDVIFDQILQILEDLKSSNTATSQQVGSVTAVLNDMAAQTLAMQGLIVTLLKSASVNGDEVAAWIRAQAKSESGDGAQKAVDFAQALIASNRS